MLVVEMFSNSSGGEGWRYEHQTEQGDLAHSLAPLVGFLASHRASFGAGENQLADYLFSPNRRFAHQPARLGADAAVSASVLLPAGTAGSSAGDTAAPVEVTGSGGTAVAAGVTSAGLSSNRTGSRTVERRRGSSETGGSVLAASVGSGFDPGC
jgi:hypothetical protein